MLTTGLSEQARRVAPQAFLACGLANSRRLGVPSST